MVLNTHIWGETTLVGWNYAKKERKKRKKNELIIKGEKNEMKNITN